MIDFKQDAKKIAEDFMRMVNCFCFKYEKHAEEFKDCKEMKKLALYWLRKVSGYHSEYRTDERNRIAQERGGKLYQVPFIREQIEKLEYDKKMNKIVELISQDHRTLQQTFSCFCFCFIFMDCSEEQQKELENLLGKEFYRMPMI